jgi:hypothetical protein
VLRKETEMLRKETVVAGLELRQETEVRGLVLCKEIEVENFSVT